MNRLIGALGRALCRPLAAAVAIGLASALGCVVAIEWPAAQTSFSLLFPRAAVAQSTVDEQGGIEIGPDPARPGTPAPPEPPDAPRAPSAPGAPLSDEELMLERDLDAARRGGARAARQDERLRELEVQLQRERRIERRRSSGQDHDWEVDGGGSGRNLVRMGQSVVVEAGEVVDDVVAIGGSLVVFGQVEGDAVAIGGDLTIKDGAWVAGDAVSVGGALDIEPGALVEGDEVEVGHFGSSMGGLLAGGYGRGHRNGWKLARSILSLLAVLFVGWLAMVLFEQRLVHLADLSSAEFARTLLAGILVLVLWPAAMVISAITIIGIPIAILLLIAVPVCAFIGYLIGALAFGRRIATGIRFERDSALAHLLTGLAAIGALGILGTIFGLGPGFLSPLAFAFCFVGFLLVSIATLAGLGALILSAMRKLEARRALPRGAAPPGPPPPVAGPPPPPRAESAGPGGDPLPGEA